MRNGTEGSKNDDNGLPANRPSRQDYILTLLRERSYVAVQDLVDRLEVSAYKIRSDLEELEASGQLQRVRGGAVSVDAQEDLPVNIRRVRFQQAKQRIGRAAAELIGHGDSIILDAGTTVVEIARHLHDRQGLTILTNSLLVAYELASSCQLNTIVCGGNMGLMNFALIGSLAEQTVRSMRVQRAFIAVGGLAVETGLTNPNLYEVGVKRAMIEAAKEIVVVADHSKVGHVALAQFAPLSQVHQLITDTEADPQIVAELEQRGVKVTLA